MSSFLLITLALFAMTLMLATVVISWRDAITERKVAPTIPDEDAPIISVIVPARDEEENITAVLQDLFAQDYPRDRMQVVVVDDGGSDGTADRVRGMMPLWPQLQLLESAGPGKKAAITTGVGAARGDLVVLTDADVRFGPLRVRSIVAHWLKERSDLIVLPVWTEGSGVLGGIQQSEQAALLGMAIG
ncbi:MAG TPA: glycosyltransferase, partial [Flavobacteriales bacterium]|nr:glycosyltransferase [Flavobacteriales bacterium]